MPQLKWCEGALILGGSAMLGVLMLLARMRIHVRNDESGMWALLGYATLSAVGYLIYHISRWIYRKIFVYVPQDVGVRRRRRLRVAVYSFALSPIVFALLFAAHKWLSSPNKREVEEMHRREIEQAKQEWNRQMDAARKADSERSDEDKRQMDENLKRWDEGGGVIQVDGRYHLKTNNQK